ncbi:ParA family protein [Nonomuraea ceibae]|uniref:ParA family protein n=1 Tax=Nonomuraea ceibae TaxID=1935170 RepID=UPI001C5CD168|nr:ParA family protein [Nonomuraea ceibae]
MAEDTDITSVVAYKGGVGKSLLAYELAYLLDAVLVDLDWDRGGVTRQWGYRHEDRIRSPLLDAFDKGKAPTPLQGYRKPLLVPSHPDLATNQPPADYVADQLEAWAQAWGRPVVVDTHPGGCETTYGAASAGRVVVCPSPLATKELEALEGMLDELADYPLLIVPNKVPRVPPAAEVARLGRLVKAAKVPVGPPVSFHYWLERRKIRVAVTSYDPVPARVKALDDELRAVAETVRGYGRHT